MPARTSSSRRATAGWFRRVSTARFIARCRSGSSTIGNSRSPPARVLGGGAVSTPRCTCADTAATTDHWGLSAGSRLWNWNAMLPHFRRLECNQKFNDEFHGSDGPLQVADPGFTCEYSHLFVKAAQALGLP